MQIENVEQLAERLKKAREAYYNLDPIMSDSEYDSLLEELKKLDPTNKEVVLVGASQLSSSPFTKVKHEIPMGSLNKVNSIEEFKTWALQIKSEELFISHKIDGLSLGLTYVDGKLTQGLSRGDGIFGEDITHNIIGIKSIPKSINKPGICYVRGEVLITKEIFKKCYSNEYANPRNTASAKLREKQCKDSENLDFRSYYLNSNTKHNKLSDQISELQQLGFKTPILSEITSLDNIEKIYELIGQNRDQIEYDIDGLVISTNSLEELENLGVQNQRPIGAIALKFQSSSKVTRACDIKWQVGPTGRIIPVMIVEPVEIGGVTITRVSLHNLSMFKSLKLFKGCRVLISRVNDVIPYCEKNLDDEV